MYRFDLFYKYTNGFYKILGWILMLRAPLQVLDLQRMVIHYHGSYDCRLGLVQMCDGLVVQTQMSFE